MKFDKKYNTFKKDKDGNLVGIVEATKPAKSKLPDLPQVPLKKTGGKAKGGK